MENQNEAQDKGKTVLVIEDEKSLRDALCHKLISKRYAILQAEDGVMGLTMSLKYHPDLILLDIGLPMMDGLSVLDKIREDDWGKTARVIILTNYGADDAKISKVVNAQPSYYLMKSDNTLEEIVEKVEEVINSKEEVI